MEGVSKSRRFFIKFAMLLAPFVILLFASFSSFARRKRRRGWAAAQIGIKRVFGYSPFGKNLASWEKCGILEKYKSLVGKGKGGSGVKWLEHLRTVNRHRRLVRKACFAVGLYRQGLCHDLSKYTPVEFLVGAKYYQGDHSPNEAERLEKGYSAAWLHHKGRNKHHLEYWIDYSPAGDHALVGCRMPEKYVVEMFCDRMAASKTYQGAAYTDASPWEYYQRSREHYLLHPESQELLERLLLLLREQGEEATFRHIREEVLNQRPKQ